MALPHYVAIDNARDQLEEVLPAFAAGQLQQRDLAYGLAALFRQQGTCRMLVDGVATPLFIGQMQAASVYLFRLPTMTDEDKLTSRAACWWDAIAGGYWEAARDIARWSRTTHNPNREHEDDFLYVMFLMQRYFLSPDGANAEARDLFDREQAARLERWRVVLEGAPDPKLDLCLALHARDRDAFQQALLETGEKRQRDLHQREATGKLLAELALWMKPVWPEGIALMRLAEVEGLGSDFDCPDVPSLLRVDPPFRYDPHAWRNIDFTPQAR
jgi:hypothetical protein